MKCLFVVSCLFRDMTHSGLKISGGELKGNVLLKLDVTCGAYDINKCSTNEPN